MEEKGADEYSDGNLESVDGISAKALAVGVEATETVDVAVSQMDSRDACVWEVCEEKFVKNWDPSGQVVHQIVSRTKVAQAKT